MRMVSVAINSWSAQARTTRSPIRIGTGRFVIDASGPGGFLHRALPLPEISFPNLPATQGLYSHFTNVRRFGDLNRDLAQHAESGLTFSPDSPPYPVDDATMHHVFDGGWIWI